MPLIAKIKQRSYYNYIIEDPENDRIFIENQAYNTKDLSGRPGEFFEFTYDTGTVVPTGDGADFSDWPVIYTNKQYGNSWSNTRTAWQSGAGRWDPWILSLDYSIIPKKIWRHKNGLIYIFYPKDITTDNLRQDVRISFDMISDVAMRQLTNDFFIHILYEREDGVLIGFNQENNVNYVAAMDFQIGETDQTPASIGVNNLQGAAGILNFFIGTNKNKSAGYFIAYNCSTHAYDIYEQGDIATTTGENISGEGGDRLLLAAGTGGYTNICYQFPSNLLQISSDAKIFYSSHWNASGVLAPRVIQWNHQGDSFSVKVCSLTYPGATSYSDYGAPPTNSNFTSSTNSVWWIKPHVFSAGSAATRFVTFCTLEKCIQNFPTERWAASQTQRNWVTYLIDPTSPDILTYHSHISWPTTWEFPRSWVPVNQLGTELLVMQNGKTVLLRFDLDNGWEIVNTQSIDARSYGIDSYGKIYLISRGMASSLQSSTTADGVVGVGYGSISLFSKDHPYNINYRYVTGDGDTGRISFDIDPNGYILTGDTGIFPTLRRGVTYMFNVEALTSDYALALRLSDGNTAAVPGAPLGNSVNGAYGTVFYYTVPKDAPNSIVYQAINYNTMIGTINIVDPPNDKNEIEIINIGFSYAIKGYNGNYPTLKIRRGQKYKLNLRGVSEIHPFAIRFASFDTTAVPWISQTNSSQGDYAKILEFTVPYDAPDSMVYQCVNHPVSMLGNITIVDASIEVSVDNRKLLVDYGNPTIKPLHPFTLDNPSYYSYDFDGTGDKLISANNDDFNFRTGDFTVEFWLWSRVAWSSQTNLAGVVGQKTGDTTYMGWQIYRNSTQANKLAVRYAGNNDFYSADDVDTAAWAHWALVRQNGILYWYKNGQQSGFTASTEDIYDFTSQFNIGMSQTSSVHLNGMISNLRICKSLAVYTGNFTVPLEPLKARQSSSSNISAIDGQCVLLTAQTNRFEDVSGLISTNLVLSSDSPDVYLAGDSSNDTYTVTTNKEYSTIVTVHRNQGDSLANIVVKNQ